MEYKEYERFACRILLNHNQPITDENVGIIIKWMLSAKDRYNSNIGTYKGFLNSYIRYAVKNIKTLAQKNKKTLYVDDYSVLADNSNMSYKDSDTFFWQDVSSLLTEYEYDVILLKYEKNMTLREIGVLKNKSHESINKTIQKSISKIRKSKIFE